MADSKAPSRSMLVGIVVALLVASVLIYVFAMRVDQPVENSLSGQDLPETSQLAN